MQRQEIPQLSEMPFQTIYHSAKEIVSMLNGKNRREKEQALSAFLAAGHCVDVHQGLETPISRLASENNEAAVDLLHQVYGANICNVIIGYAYGGNVEKVKRLAITISRQSYAVVGYAFACNTIEAEREAKKLAGSSFGKDQDQYLLIGYACGGWDEVVNNLILSRGNLWEIYTLWGYAAWGYALGGRVERVKKILEKYPNMAPGTGLAGAYALGGFAQQVNELLAMRPVLDYAGGFQSRDFAPGALASILASIYYADGGHFAQVNQLFYGPSQLCKNGILIRFLLKKYVNAGYVAEINKLHDLLANTSKSQGGTVLGSLFDPGDCKLLTSDSVLHTLTLIQNPVLQKSVAKIIKKDHLGSRKWLNEPALINVKQLQKRANQLTLLMNIYSVDYRRALTLDNYPELQNLINHFGLSYDQALSILKEPGLIGFFQYCHWLEQQQGIALSDIIALCTSFTAGLAHEDARNLYQISIKTGFFSQSLAHKKQESNDQPGQKGNKIKHTLSHVLNRFKKH